MCTFYRCTWWYCTTVYTYIDDELKASSRLKIIAMAQNGNLVEPNKLHYYRKGFGAHGTRDQIYLHRCTRGGGDRRDL